MTALAVEALTYRYPGAAAPALADVTLDVAEGELVVLAGPSGSGKSTLLRAACGLVPHAHGGEIAGRVRVCGLDTREHDTGCIAAVAGTLLQDPETQVVMGGVRAELALALENRGAGPAQVARAVEEVALALGIEALLERPTHELSGGELQRVALGAALVGRPRVVLLDEPTSQLDPVAGDELIWLLRRLNEEWGTTIVLVEHRLERCVAAADRVIALAGGTVACDAAPDAFLGWAARAAPALCTPGASLLRRVGLPARAGVKAARAQLRSAGLVAPSSPGEPDSAAPDRPRGRRAARREAAAAALAFDRVWHERHGGRTVLRALTLAVAPGERVALLGRNGAGKSTLLRHAAGLMEPTRGRVRTAGRVALLLQHPGDYLLHERVADEASPAALEAVGLTGFADRHPRDLSGGERQRLALAVALGDPDLRPAAVCLDEPTRGMDRERKADLARRLEGLAEAGAAVVVATHDVEFAATLATRAVLLADGAVIADGDPHALLAGGWYFSTETARILDGRALLPEEGAAALTAPLSGAAGPGADPDPDPDPTGAAARPAPTPHPEVTTS